MIAPQNPFLFTGSFRENVDPFNEYDDNELRKSLKPVELNVFVKNHSKARLNSVISEARRGWSKGDSLLC